MKSFDFSFLFAAHPELLPLENALIEATTILSDCFRKGGKLLVCGNGGSASDALHIVGELMKDFVLPRRIPEEDSLGIAGISPEDTDLLSFALRGALPAIALVGSPALESAYANDAEPKVGFAQEVYGYGKSGDVLLCISTSGNSENVRLAAVVAKAKDMKVISLTGKGGGKLAPLSDALIDVPETETYRVQELHLPVYHALCLVLEQEFFGTSPSYMAGVDIGGTKCAMTLAKKPVGSEPPLILGKKKIPTAGAPGNVIEALAAGLEELLAEQKLSPKALLGIGIASGSPLDAVKGIIESPPNLPGWDNVPITEFFEKRFGVPALLRNDADASALAEWKYGAGRGSRHMIFLTFGTGFGAGLILDGKLYSGKGSNAGEVGHTRLRFGGVEGYGKIGSAEGLCSGGGMARLARLRLRTDPLGAKPLLNAAGDDEGSIDARLLCDMARAGDPFCTSILSEVGEALGEVLSTLIDLFDPERIVIGGVFMRAHDLLMPHVQKVLEKETLHFSLAGVEILPAGLGESVGDYSALSIL